VRNRYFFVLDVLLVCLAAFGSFALRFDWYFLSARPEFPVFLLTALLVKPIVMYCGGMYGRYWHYATTSDMVAVLLSVSTASALISVLIPVLMMQGVLDTLSRSVIVIDWLLTLLFVAGIRVSARLRNDMRGRVKAADSARNVVVVGAGNTGMVVVREMQRNRRLGKHVIGFLDDDADKLGKQIYGVPVLGRIVDLATIAAKHHCDEIIIAMPSAPGRTVREVVDRCRRLGLRSLTIPGVYELLDDKVSVSTLREIDIADLLRRSPAQTRERAHQYIRGRRVLVTGAGGSIGSELCRQIAHLAPHQLILLGHGENSLFELSQELADMAPALDHQVAIADIRDERRVRQIFRQFKPDVVFHAAAHKHVGLMEQNREEALTNNILGTHRVASAAIETGTERFVLVSTDKAVRSAGVMGASKRVAEEIVRQVARATGRAYVVVRFGNVLGSHGSVVPIFKRQIQRGGPVTVTDPGMRRFFMTIPEAVHLMLEAGGLGRGGELYVLRMGEPVAIVDLARDLIQLSGFSLDEIPIVFTGPRPGEKLTEQLWEDGAVLDDTEHPDVVRVSEPPLAITDAHAAVAQIVAAVESGDQLATDALVQAWLNGSPGAGSVIAFPTRDLRTQAFLGE
jgi:FlaA1/EpsC-like NDP-sugar epimerase